jgi:hypothetical protein
MARQLMKVWLKEVMKMNKTVPTILLTVILLLGSIPVQAQMGQTMIDALRTQLEMTDEVLERARTVVQSSRNPAALLTLRQAAEIQGTAKQAFTATRYEFAAALTRKARELAKQALAMGRASEQYEGLVLRALEKAEQLLERAREILSDHDNRNLHTVLESAIENLGRAMEFHREFQYKPALKLAAQAAKAAQKIIQIANQERKYQIGFDRNNDNIAQLLERTRSILANCDSEPASNLILQAEKVYQQAIKWNEEGKPEHALQALKRSRDMLRRVNRLCQSDNQLVRRYEQLSERAGRLKDRLNDNPGVDNQAVQSLLDVTFEQLKRALQFIDAQQVEQAQAALQAAKLALQQAEKRP